MRKISANYVLPVTSAPVKNGIITIDDNGYIIDITKNNESTEFSRVEFYNGIIVPGFINTHCHSELTYLKGQFERGGGLIKFLYQIVNFYRNAKVSIDEKAASVEIADQEMFKNGIVAVGDISNHGYSAETKNKSSIYYHTFIELIDDFNDARGKQKLEKAESLINSFKNSSLAIHSHYDCSADFIKTVSDLSEKSGLFSIHNQESQEENLLFMNKSGKIPQLFEDLGLIEAMKKFSPTGKTSFISNLNYFSNKNNNILVHNTYTTVEDLEFLKNSSLKDSVYFAFCPLSNLFIEERLPDFYLFKDFWDRCTIGTDSYASNTKLNILEEMKQINVPFDEKLRWATINGAKALNISSIYGSIEKGKRPGLNLITNFDFEQWNIKENSKVKRLV